MNTLSSLLKFIGNKIKFYDGESSWTTVNVGVGLIRYRKIGKIVFVNGYTLSGDHNVLLYTLPNNYRPSERQTVPASFPLDGERIYINIETNGGVTPIRDGGTPVKELYFSTCFVAN